MPAEPLLIIYQQLSLTGEIPDFWGTASVMSIYKKGQEEESGNYRAVSLTSVPEWSSLSVHLYQWSG